MSTVRMSILTVALAALTLCVFASQSVAQTYTLTDLGTIAGNSVSTGYALNSTGHAAGTSSTPTAAIAVLFSNSKVTDISTLGSNVSVATGINGSGEIVGWNDFYSNPNFDPQAFLYSNGSMKSIDAPSVFPSGTEASAINDSGEVVGTGYFTSGNFHAFLYSGGKMQDLGPPGAYQSSAIAINNSGQIIGGYYVSAANAGEFVITNGKMTTLPVPSGASGVAGFGINDDGEIAGAIFFSSGAPSHAAKFANGVLDRPGGDHRGVGEQGDLRQPVWRRCRHCVLSPDPVPPSQAGQARAVHFHGKRAGEPQYAHSRGDRVRSYRCRRNQ